MFSSWTLTMIGLTVLCFTFQYFLGPILVRAKISQPLNRSFIELPADYPLIHLPPTFPQKLYELEVLGFSLVGHLGFGADQTRVNGIMSVLVNRHSNTIATVAYLAAKSAVAVKTAHFVEFSTDFADGSEIDTLNSPSVSIFLPVPNRTQTRVPHLRHAGALYHVHCYLMSQRASLPVLPPVGHELSHIRESVRRSLDQQVELGYYFVDETAQRYRPTWHAAIRSTWRLLWPLKQIIQSQQSRAGRRLAEAAGVRS